MKAVHWIMILLFLVLGVYFVNGTFKFLEVPKEVVNLNQWIEVVGGLLLVYGAYDHYQANRYSA